MKRYFQPVAKDGSAKKPTLSPPSRKDGDGDGENEETLGDAPKKEPLKFMTWNANSFLLRVKNDWPEFTSFVTRFDPDIIAIQVIQYAQHCFKELFSFFLFSLFLVLSF